MSVADITSPAELVTFVAGVVLIGLIAVGVARFFIKPAETEKTAAAPWDAVDALSVGAVIFLVPQVAVGVLVQSIFRQTDSVYVNFLMVAGIEAGSLWLLARFLRRRGASFRELGFKKPHGRDVLYVFMAFGVYFVLLATALGLINHYVPGFNGEQEQITGFEDASGPGLLITFMALVVLPPLAEEIVFRGFLYKGLRTKFKVLPSALIVSGLFAFAHAQWNVAVDTFILSMVMIFVLERSKNLWVTVGLHALKNSIAFLALYFLK